MIDDPTDEISALLRGRTYTKLAGSMHSKFEAGEFTNCPVLQEKLDTIFHDALGALFHTLPDLRKQVICAVLSSSTIPNQPNSTLVKNLVLTNEATLLSMRFKCSTEKMTEFLACLNDERLLYFQYDCLDTLLERSSRSSQFLQFGPTSLINSLPRYINEVSAWMGKFYTEAKDIR